MAVVELFQLTFNLNRACREKAAAGRGNNVRKGTMTCLSSLFYMFSLLSVSPFSASVFLLCLLCIFDSVSPASLCLFSFCLCHCLFPQSFSFHSFLPTPCFWQETFFQHFLFSLPQEGSPGSLTNFSNCPGIWGEGKIRKRNVCRNAP